MHWERRYELLHDVSTLMRARGVRQPDALDDEDWCDLFVRLDEDEQVRSYKASLEADEERAAYRRARSDGAAARATAEPSKTGAVELSLRPPQSAVASGGAAALDGGGGGEGEGGGDGDDDDDDNDEALERALEGARKVRALRKLVRLAAAAQPRVDFAAEWSQLTFGGSRRGEFTAATVRAPLVATGGEFVIWLSELPPHIIYPQVRRCRYRAPARSLARPPPRSPPPPPPPPRPNARHRHVTRPPATAPPPPAPAPPERLARRLARAAPASAPPPAPCRRLAKIRTRNSRTRAGALRPRPSARHRDTGAPDCAAPRHPAPDCA